MNKFFFNKNSPLYPFRWFIIITTVLVLWEAYADFTGWRIVSFADSETQWGSGRPRSGGIYGSGVRHK